MFCDNFDEEGFFFKINKKAKVLWWQVVYKFSVKRKHIVTDLLIEMTFKPFLRVRVAMHLKCIMYILQQF